MQLLPDPDKGKWYALGLLLLVLLAIYFLVFQGFIEKHQSLNEQLAEATASRQKYARLAASIPELKKRLRSVREQSGQGEHFLKADSANLAAAELIRTLKEIVGQHVTSAQDCLILSNQLTRDREPEQFERVILKVRLRCRYDILVAVLNDLEQHKPDLFVDELRIEQRYTRSTRRGQPQPRLLEVRFDLYAYLNKPVKKKDAKK
jgi:general secretion pathway protein M